MDGVALTSFMWWDSSLITPKTGEQLVLLDAALCTVTPTVELVICSRIANASKERFL